MKITINLYQESLKPKKEYLTLKNVAIATALSLIMVFFWTGVIYYNNQTVISQSKALQSQISMAEETLNNYQQALIKHNDSATFMNQKNRLERELQVKSILLNEIINKQSGRAVNFHQVMKDLTEHHDHDLWLTEFMFNRDEVLFNGYTTASSSVTRWMTYLQATSSFKGREFKHLRVQAVDEQVLSFQAGTAHIAVVAEGVGR